MSFEKTETRLIWRYGGETVIVEPWGKDSLRVLARLMGEPEETDYALLPCDKGEPEIEIGEGWGSIANGRIRAEIRCFGWQKDRAHVRFFNDRGELLLEEMGDTGALALNPHAYKPILGGDHQVTVSFEAREDEKFYGMEQSQNRSKSVV